MYESGYIYILTNTHNPVLYVGVTSNLWKRISEHKSKKIAGFAKKYNLHKLVYFENCGNIIGAIMREKQIKAGSRARKLALITSLNPGWTDLSSQVLE